MSKKVIFFITLVLVVIVMTVIVLIMRSPANNIANSTDATTSQALVAAPTTAPTPTITSLVGAPQGVTFQIGTPEGTVTVNNFYNKPLVLDEEYITIDTNANYQINYDTETSQFIIYFNSDPSSNLQIQGERDFLALLGVSDQDACKLNVLEQYPGHSSFIEEGHELSFCNANSAY